MPDAFEAAVQPGVFRDADAWRFVVWAPERGRVELRLETPDSPRTLALQPAGKGYFSVTARAPEGARYGYLVDGEGPWPDPCSRSQPDGPHGLSALVDTAAFAWTDSAWRGLTLPGQVFYELHVGAFTPAGTFDAARAELPRLATLGITVIELMPVAEFPGRFNWGYDGVQLFAPFHGYGEPAALARFIDAAHAQGIGVILDVVYNHLGPDGNYLGKFSPYYVSPRYANEWGDALNFDGPHSHGVRSFFLENARYWIGQFHFDGLRLDATQSIHDSSAPHILAEIAAAARAAAAGRSIVLVGENEPQDLRCLHAPSQGGFGLDGLWNDDFHHAARVAATGRHHGYFTDYRGSAQELISATKRGFLYQGQWYRWQGKRRGTPVTDEPAAAFITFTQNHDQVANTFDGQRLHRLTTPALERALTALLLLAPQTPLLFMGQEFAASTPFPFFADHGAALRDAVHEGRRDFLAQFPAYAAADARARIADPADPATFESAKLSAAQLPAGAQVTQLYRDLLTLRRNDAVLKRQDRFALDGAVLGERAFALRWSGGAADGDRLLVVNLGAALDLAVVPEPLLAPPVDHDWRCVWDSEEPRYGGSGIAPVHEQGRWNLPATHAAFWCARPFEPGERQ